MVCCQQSVNDSYTINVIGPCMQPDCMQPNCHWDCIEIIDGELCHLDNFVEYDYTKNVMICIFCGLTQLYQYVRGYKFKKQCNQMIVGPTGPL